MRIRGEADGERKVLQCLIYCDKIKMYVKNWGVVTDILLYSICCTDFSRSAEKLIKRCGKKNWEIR